MKKILITGSNGLLGNSLKKILGDSHVYHERLHADLTKFEETNNYITHCVKNMGVDTIINCAAKVGGVLVNSKNNHSFFLDNFNINNNVITSALNLEVKNFVNLSSTCVFPSEKIKYPLTAEQIDLGPPHNSNFGYAYAKRLSTYTTSTINKTFGWNWITVIPTNVYGINDNFNLEDSHVIPGLIHRAYLSSKTNSDFLVWGNGEPLRQFIHVDDLSKNILWALENWNSEIPFMCVNPKEYKILQIVDFICKKYKIDKNRIKFDNTKPNGQHRKPAITNIPEKYEFVDFDHGISEVIDWFIENYDAARK
jgi:GDP-L-fucose synthase